MLYELHTGDFARVDFASDGHVLNGYQLPRKDSLLEVRQFFVDQKLMVPWDLSDRLQD